MRAHVRLHLRNTWHTRTHTQPCIVCALVSLGHSADPAPSSPQCRLVHADLSEYNILYHKGELYIIDVSQSVEHDHPHALEFLRSDCLNITDFFGKRGVPTMTSKVRTACLVLMCDM